MSPKSAARVSIIDYGMGNLFSVSQACEQAGVNPVITADAAIIASSDALILPGVGAFGDAMDSLIRLDLIVPVKDFIKSGKRILGVCLGMQLLMDESEEFGTHKGFGIIPGKVVRFPVQAAGGRRNKVPQVGWNRIHKNAGSAVQDWAQTPLADIIDDEFMYFVHSYYVVPEQKELALTVTMYGNIEYCSSLLYKNIFAVQFHPEKSHVEGIRIYRNWIKSLNA